MKVDMDVTKIREIEKNCANVSDSAPLTGSVHVVTGDHPAFRRPDRRFTDRDSFIEAVAYAKELAKAGYENIFVSEAEPNA